MTTRRALPSSITEGINSSNKDNQPTRMKHTYQRSKDDDTDLPNTQHKNSRDEESSLQPASEVHTGSTSTIAQSFLDNRPESLNCIREYITEKDGDTCLPLHSTILHKKTKKDAPPTTRICRKNNGRICRFRRIQERYVIVRL